MTRDELTELKGNYLVELANEGRFAEVMGRNYDFPDWDDVLNADKYVPDDVIFREYEGVGFVKDDFFCNQQ